MFQVVYTCGNNLQLRVHVEKVDPKTRVHTTTNILYFTFSTMSPVPQVVPKSYSGDNKYTITQLLCSIR